MKFGQIKGKLVLVKNGALKVHSIFRLEYSLARVSPKHPSPFPPSLEASVFIVPKERMHFPSPCRVYHIHPFVQANPRRILLTVLTRTRIYTQDTFTHDSDICAHERTLILVLPPSPRRQPSVDIRNTCYA